MKGFNLFLSVAYEAYRHGLHAPCRQPLADFAPEQRREFISDDAVEHTACLLCVHLLHVDGARMMDRFGNGGLCDLMENDAAVLLWIDA